MRKRKSTTNLIQFPQASSVRAEPPPIAKAAESLFGRIPRSRVMLLCDAVNYRFRGDSVGLEAVLGLVCAVADPDGDQEKFITARTALFELTVENLDYKPIAAWLEEATRKG